MASQQLWLFLMVKIGYQLFSCWPNEHTFQKDQLPSCWPNEYLPRGMKLPYTGWQIFPKEELPCRVHRLIVLPKRVWLFDDIDILSWLGLFLPPLNRYNSSRVSLLVSSFQASKICWPKYSPCVLHGWSWYRYNSYRISFTTFHPSSLWPTGLILSFLQGHPLMPGETDQVTCPIERRRDHVVCVNSWCSYAGCNPLMKAGHPLMKATRWWRHTWWVRLCQPLMQICMV